MSKGGSTSTSVEIPEYIEQAAKFNLRQAGALGQPGIAQIGYTPYYGPDVAAFTPTQEAAFQNVAGQAGAFGLATPAGGAMAGMPAPQEFAGGFRGYSSAPIYEAAVQELGARRPGQRDLIESFFVDPYTGQAGSAVSQAFDYAATPTAPVVDAVDTGGTPTPVITTPIAPPEPPYVPEIPYVPQIPVAEVDEPVVIYDPAVAGPGDIIAATDIDALSDAMTDIGLGGIPDTAGQQYQYYNPDIDYTDAFKSDITGQYVGTLDPSAEGIEAVQTAQEQLGIQPVDDDFYTEQPIYSASDLPLGSSTQGVDFSVYAGDDDRGADVRENIFGSQVSTGYDVGQVDPALATAAGYTEAPSEPEPVYYQGESNKNNAVAEILKDKYGWSEEKLAEEGYEGYAPDEPKNIVETITAPIVDLFTPEPSDRESEISAMGAAEAEVPLSAFGGVGPDVSATVTSSSDDTSPVITTAREDNFASDLTRSLTDETYDPPGNVITRALGITDTSDNDNDGSDDSGGGGDGCVVATHAVGSGAFTPSMKREAVVWCMHNLHDKWWGEAIRRGYRHLGRKKIEQGKAHEHYQEFRDYIAFANGKKRTIRGAINFTLRTAQFFAVGLIKKEA